LEKAYFKAHADQPELLKKLREVKGELLKTEQKIYGSKAKNEVGEKNTPTLNDRLYILKMNMEKTSYGPTGTDLKTMQIVESETKNLEQQIQSIRQQLKQIEDKMQELHIPYVNTGICSE